MHIAGVDEVGRGPLAGPVLACAVILDPNNPIIGLNDSKKLSEKKRLQLSQEIKLKALSYAFGFCSAKEIDHHNILQASLLAMKKAVENLNMVPDKVLVDGNRCPAIRIPSEAIVGGDALIPEISAASILAKVARDHLMSYFDARYPQYGFSSHKGYPTAKHLQVLKQFGVLPFYRKSFAPVKALIESD